MNIILLYVQILFKRKNYQVHYLLNLIHVCVYDQIIIMSATIFWNIFLMYFYINFIVCTDFI